MKPGPNGSQSVPRRCAPDYHMHTPPVRAWVRADLQNKDSDWTRGKQGLEMVLHRLLVSSFHETQLQIKISIYVVGRNFTLKKIRIYCLVCLYYPGRQNKHDHPHPIDEEVPGGLRVSQGDPARKQHHSHTRFWHFL